MIEDHAIPQWPRTKSMIEYIGWWHFTWPKLLAVILLLACGEDKGWFGWLTNVILILAAWLVLFWDAKRTWRCAIILCRAVVRDWAKEEL